MKFAVEAMQRRDSADLVASCFIHGRGVALQRTPLGVFRALLSSLLKSFPVYLQKLTKQFKDQEERFGTYERKDGWAWTESELEDFLSEVLSKGTRARPVTIYVDALDECGEHDAKRLLKYFNNIMSVAKEQQGMLKICFSSRHYPILGSETIPTLLVEERNDKDIRMVVQNRLKTLKSYNKLRQIENDILLKAQGGFQWAILITDIVSDGVLQGLNTARLHDSVTTVPETLQDLYEVILDNANEEDRGHMIKLFQWVLFSERPLSAHELREAFTTSQDMVYTTTSQLRDHSSYSDTVSEFETRVRHISRGLVEFQSRDIWEIYQTDGEDWDREAQFIHQSAADFVLQSFLTKVKVRPNSQPVVGMGHFELSRSCLKYITMQDILESSKLSRSELSARFPLLPYAITFLFRHIKLVEQTGMAQTDLLELIQWYHPDRLRMLSALWLVMDPDCGHTPMGWPFLGATAPHILVGLGSLSSLQIFLNQNTVDFNASDSHGNTPILFALQEGREDMALLLLNRSVDLQAEQRISDPDGSDIEQAGKEVDYLRHVNTANSVGETPLGMAASTKSHEAIIALLRAGANPKTEKELLFYAIGNRKKLLLMELIQREVCLDGAVFFAAQTLRLPSQRGHEMAVNEMLWSLLNAGANTRRCPSVREELDLEELDPDGDSDEDEHEEALFFAANYGLTSLVELLFMHGVSPTLQNSDGHYPLLVAGTNGHIETAEVILNGMLETAEVIFNGMLETAEVILNGMLETAEVTRGAIEDTLYDLIAYGSAEVVALILKGLYGDKIPRKVLDQCVQYGNLEVAKFVLQSNKQMSSSTVDDPQSLLWFALREDDYELAALSLEKGGVDPTAEGENGETPLRWCLRQSKTDMVKLFLRMGKVGIHKSDKPYESPFWWTMRKGSYSMVSLFLSEDESNIDKEDWFGRTAYWWIVQRKPAQKWLAIAEGARLYKHHQFE